MKRTPSNATKWFYWFSLGVALLIAHALFSNVANIYSFVARVTITIMPFLIALILAFLLYKPAATIEKILKTKLKVKKGARVISVILVYILLGLLIYLFASFIIFLRNCTSSVVTFPSLGVSSSNFCGNDNSFDSSPIF